MNKIKFTKMHGLGNDFIIVDCINDEFIVPDLRAFTKEVCNRNFGVGADGLILIESSKSADYKMRIINSDGSEAEMCGNGVRCFAKYIYDTRENKKEIISVETLRGIVLPAVILLEGKVVAIEVDMGEPILERAKIPMTGKNSERVIDEEIKFEHHYFVGTAVSMGNPHFVIFVNNLDEVNVPYIGPKIEHLPIFPKRTNVEFVKIESSKEATIELWERGSGRTLACGTGACAVLIAGVLTGRLKRKCVVNLPGGSLSIEWSIEDNHVFLTGPAETVFEGVYYA